jgi:hypothetical protein
VLGLPAPDVDLEERGVAVAPLAVLLDPLGHRDPQVGDGDAARGEAEIGVLDQVADDGGVVVGCHNRCSLLLYWRWLAFGTDAFRHPTSAGGLVAGGLEGVGGPVVLAGLPDVRVGVVLAAVVDSHPDPEGQGGLTLGDVAVADAVNAVSGDAEAGVEPVEGLLAGPLGWPVVVVVAPVVGVQIEGLGGQLLLG